MTSKNSVSPARRRIVSHVSGVGLALAVADRPSTLVVDQEDGGLAVRRARPGRSARGSSAERQRLQALERLALRLPVVASPKRTVRSCSVVRLRRRRRARGRGRRRRARAPVAAAGGGVDGRRRAGGGRRLPAGSCAVVEPSEFGAAAEPVVVGFGDGRTGSCALPSTLRRLARSAAVAARRSAASASADSPAPARAAARRRRGGSGSLASASGTAASAAISRIATGQRRRWTSWRQMLRDQRSSDSSDRRGGGRGDARRRRAARRPAPAGRARGRRALDALGGRDQVRGGADLRPSACLRSSFGVTEMLPSRSSGR